MEEQVQQFIECIKMLDIIMANNITYNDQIKLIESYSDNNDTTRGQIESLNTQMAKNRSQYLSIATDLLEKFSDALVISKILEPDLITNFEKNLESVRSTN